MGEIIKVGMADLKIAHSPDILTTLGLGSCVGIALYDPVTRIGGLLHLMLPDSTRMRNNENPAKFADTGLVELIKQMEMAGAKKDRMVAKIAGGAKMFASVVKSDTLMVGERNIEAAKSNLRLNGIPLKAEDVGENFGRTVELNTLDGSYVIKAIGKGVKTI